MVEEGKGAAGGREFECVDVVLQQDRNPVQRAEKLVRCRDHLVPGSIFYLALQSPVVRANPWIAEHMGQGSTMFSAWVLGRLTFIPRAALSSCTITPAAPYSCARVGSTAVSGR